MPDMSDIHRPWYVDLDASWVYGEDFFDGEEPRKFRPKAVKISKCDDPRPPAEGTQRNVVVRGQVISNLFIDDSGRVYLQSGKELPLLNVEVIATPNAIFAGVEGGTFSMMLQAPRDARGKHTTGQQHWFMDARKVWDENLPTKPKWLP